MPSRVERWLDRLTIERPEKFNDLLDTYWRLHGAANGRLWWQLEREADREEWADCIRRAIVWAANRSNVPPAKLADWLDSGFPRTRETIVKKARELLRG